MLRSAVLLYLQPEQDQEAALDPAEVIEGRLGAEATDEIETLDDTADPAEEDAADTPGGGFQLVFLV